LRETQAPRARTVFSAGRRACCSIRFFSGTKLAWLLDHVPPAPAAARKKANWPSAPWTPGCSAAHRRPRPRTDVSTPRAPSCSTSAPRLGRRAAARASHSASLPEVRASSGHLWRGVRRARLNGVPSAHRRRPAAALFGQACWGPAWRRTPTAPAASFFAHTAASRSPRKPSAHHRRWKIDGRLEITPSRVPSHRRRGGAVAARRTRAHRQVVDVEKLAARPPTTAASTSSGLRRPRRRIGMPRRAAITGLTRGSHAGHLASGRAREHRPTRAPTAPRHGGRRRAQTARLRVDGGRSATTAHAVPGGPPARAGRPPRTTETTGWARPTWRISRSVSWKKSRGDCQRLWSADRTFRPRAPPPSRAACWPSASRVARAKRLNRRPAAAGKAPVNQLFFTRQPRAGLQAGLPPGPNVSAHTTCLPHEIFRSLAAVLLCSRSALPPMRRKAARSPASAPGRQGQRHCPIQPRPRYLRARDRRRSGRGLCLAVTRP